MGLFPLMSLLVEENSPPNPSIVSLNHFPRMIGARQKKKRKEKKILERDDRKRKERQTKKKIQQNG